MKDVVIVVPNILLTAWLMMLTGTLHLYKTNGMQLAWHLVALCHSGIDHLESSNLRGNVIILV